MSFIEQMIAVPPVPTDWRRAIEALPNPHVPTESIKRQHDVRAMGAIGLSVRAPRLVFATTNVALSLLPVRNVDDHVERIEFLRDDVRDLALRLGCTRARSWAGPDDVRPGPTTLIMDAADAHLAADMLRTELQSGACDRVFMHHSLRCWSRELLEAMKESVHIAHHVCSSGLSEIRPIEGGTGLGPLLDALPGLVDESGWLLPGARTRLNERVKSGEASDAIADLVVRLRQVLEFVRTDLVPASGGPAPDGTSDGEPAGILELVRSVAIGRTEHEEHLLRTLLGVHRDHALRDAGRFDERVRAGDPEGTLIQIGCDLLGRLSNLRELAYWSRHQDIGGNQTLTLAARSEAGRIRPFPSKPISEYSDFYSFVGEVTAPTDASERSGGDRTDVSMFDVLDHTMRKHAAAQTCGFILSRLAMRYPNDTIRWLDLGCGDGAITNGADTPAWMTHRLDAIGLEFSAARVAYANSTAARGRSFRCVDAIEPPNDLLGQRFHLITAFEFLEHLHDPVSILRRYVRLDPDFVIGGSPLDEPQAVLPAFAHLWSFSSAGYASLFEEAGLKIAMVNECRIGRYSQGNDWVTVVGSTRGPMEALPPEGMEQRVSGRTTAHV